MSKMYEEVYKSMSETAKALRELEEYGNKVLAGIMDRHEKANAEIKESFNRLEENLKEMEETDKEIDQIVKEIDQLFAELG